MKIMMLNPPYFDKFSKNSRSPGISKGGCVYYPLWLGYATGLLEKEGFDVKLVDAGASPIIGRKEVMEIVKEYNPKLVVIDTSTASIANDVKVLEEIKEINSNIFAVLVGPHVSALPEESIKISESINAVARREFDFTLRELALALKDLEKENLSEKYLENRLKEIKGLTYRKKDSEGKEKIMHNPDRELITGKELDEFPFVSEVWKKHLNVKDYFYPANLYPEIQILGGRGCVYQCAFCVLPQTMMGHSYRRRSAENIADEFEYIEKEFPYVKEVFIEDDTFTKDKEEVRKFCDELIKRKTKVQWSCNARADVDYETLRKMKESNCRLLCVGFESANQKILNNIKKGTVIPKIKQFMKATKKAGILVHGCFLLGNKGETKETIRETVEMAKEMNPDTAQFFPLMVYPGTRAFNWAKEEGLLTTCNWQEWLKEDGTHNTILSRPGLTADELVKACDDARREFYMRPGYVARKAFQMVRHPKEMKRILKSSRTFFKYLFNAN